MKAQLLPVGFLFPLLCNGFLDSASHHGLQRTRQRSPHACAMCASGTAATAEAPPTARPAKRRGGLTAAERRERNLAVFAALKAQELCPARVFASTELRQRLRLTGREKRQRVFIPREQRSDPAAVLEAIREALPLGELPVVLLAHSAAARTETADALHQQQEGVDAEADAEQQQQRVPVSSAEELEASFAVSSN
jgi:hypothetical protein